MNVNLGDYEVMSVLSGEKPVKVNVSLDLANIIILLVGLLAIAALYGVFTRKILK